MTFANAVADAGEGGDPSVAAFLEGLDAGEHGPGYSRLGARPADAVQVLTAHGAAGLEFDTVIVAGAVEGNFPSLTRPEPMFDLASLERSIANAERNRPGSRTSAVCSRWCSGGRGRGVVLACATRIPTPTSCPRGRGSSTSCGVPWTDVPAGPFDEPVERARGAGRLAAHARRPVAAGVAAPRRARRAARARRRPRGMVVPARLDRHGTSAPRVDARLVLAPVEPRELRAAARARRRARARARSPATRPGSASSCTG